MIVVLVDCYSHNHFDCCCIHSQLGCCCCYNQHCIGYYHHYQFYPGNNYYSGLAPGCCCYHRYLDLESFDLDLGLRNLNYKPEGQQFLLCRTMAVHSSLALRSLTGLDCTAPWLACSCLQESLALTAVGKYNLGLEKASHS